MYIRLIALLALLLPAAALAQVVPKTTSVEIVAKGAIDLPANAFTVKIEWTSKGADEAEARKAQAANQAAVREALGTLGVSGTAISINEGDVSTEPDYGLYDSMANATVTMEEVTVENAADGDWTPPPPVSTISDYAIVRFTSFAQVLDARKALSPLGAHITSVTPMLDDNDGARRQVKAKALTAARADANGYASTLGMRVVRVIRISEAGNGLFLPGFQDKFQQMIFAGPSAMRNMLGETKPGFVHLEATIVVEFELAP